MTDSLRYWNFWSLWASLLCSSSCFLAGSCTRYETEDFMKERDGERSVTSQPVREVEVGRRSTSSGIFAAVAPPQHAESEIGSMKLGASDWGEIARSHQVKILIVAGIIAILAGAALAVAIKAYFAGLASAGVGLLLIAIGVYPVMLWAVPVVALAVGVYLLWNTKEGAKLRARFRNTVDSFQQAKDELYPKSNPKNLAAREKLNKAVRAAQDKDTSRFIDKMKGKA
jgi:hypothetical protein